MNTESAGVPFPMPAASADRLVPRAVSTARVRAYRQRRRLGVHYVKVSVGKFSVEALVRMGNLPEAQQQDVSAVQQAVQIYVTDAPHMP
jgi:hypothetical protein